MTNSAISGKTNICGIIGDPIEHTISPAMHNAAFRVLNIDYVYVPFRVRKEKLHEAIDGVRALEVRGFNVTIPHKVAIIPYLDEIDILAEQIGAVNTVVNNNGTLKGFNTDATGFLEALRAEKVSPEGKKVVIIGAGGASRAVSFILAENGARITILNRLPGLGRAQGLAQMLSSHFGQDIAALELNEDNLAGCVGPADILVNTTSVGMSPDIPETPVPSRFLKSGLTVFDIIYNPLKTRLLREAEKKGALVISGLEMLVRQGAAAFEMWTGLQSPVYVMRKAVTAELQKSEN